MIDDGTRDPRLARAQQHAARGEVLQAESLLRALLLEYPACLPARAAVAAFLADRDDFDAARALLQAAPLAQADDPELRLATARLHWQAREPGPARTTLEALVASQPDHHVGWLMLGEACDVLGDTLGALRARHQAFDRAQKKGLWTGPDSTEPGLLQAVLGSMDAFRRARRQRLFDIVHQMRGEYGGTEMNRVERALTGYLGEWNAKPPDSRQQPKFFYFPDLPPGPYHDPWLQPWCRSLQEAWPEIRAEALALLPEESNFEDFMGLPPGPKPANYLGGAAAQPAWDAFFFYRHAKRFDDHHARAPVTSGLLESIELCRVRNQAPEILFSVLRPQSTIMPHYGVTNTRLVFHLPLLVPPDCALHVVDHGAHHWREGEPMMFDDTYLHEAWNRSDRVRVILLMDCWNPHLSDPEKHAVRLLVEAIDAIEN